MLVLLVASVLLVPRQEVRADAKHALTLADGQSLELRASWEPCKTSMYELFASTPALRSPAPARANERHPVELFRPFLPAAPVALGETWKVEPNAVLAFLRQFHPGARLRGHFDGGEVPGTFACLRAVSEDAFEILLRAQAVFELEDRVLYKPAQFEGRLWLGRGNGKLVAFHLALPSRDPNVDVNVPEEGGSTVMADIGWVPRMELASAETPEPAWREELQEDAARVALRRCFYEFAALEWLPFDEAVLRSRASGKPLHLVLLFGALDDDSC